MDEVRLGWEVVGQAYNNYKLYEESLSRIIKPKSAELGMFLRFKRLVDFEKGFLRSDMGEKHYSSEAEWLEFNEPTARLLRLMAGPHYHTIIKAKLATKGVNNA